MDLSRQKRNQKFFQKKQRTEPFGFIRCCKQKLVGLSFSSVNYDALCSCLTSFGALA